MPLALAGSPPPLAIAARLPVGEESGGLLRAVSLYGVGVYRQPGGSSVLPRHSGFSVKINFTSNVRRCFL